jgi:hypothetical protein
MSNIITAKPIVVRVKMDSPLAGPAIAELLARVLNAAGATVSFYKDLGSKIDDSDVPTLKGLHFHLERPTWVREEEVVRWNTP